MCLEVFFIIEFVVMMIRACINTKVLTQRAVGKKLFKRICGGFLLWLFEKELKKGRK